MAAPPADPTDERPPPLFASLESTHPSMNTPVTSSFHPAAQLYSATMDVHNKLRTESHQVSMGVGGVRREINGWGDPAEGPGDQWVGGSR